jgi:hypothetical protein
VSRRIRGRSRDRYRLPGRVSSWKPFPPAIICLKFNRS